MTAGSKRLSAQALSTWVLISVRLRPLYKLEDPRGWPGSFSARGAVDTSPARRARIHFLPTFGLELLEAAALSSAIEEGEIEPRRPMVRTFDVLVQFLCTLAVGDGFRKDSSSRLVSSTHAFSEHG